MSYSYEQINELKDLVTVTCTTNIDIAFQVRNGNTQTALSGCIDIERLIRLHKILRES